jgi:LysR family transcriptional regulator of abg operon
LELQQIQHFLVIARLGSVSQAADELGITQSGLSRSLKTMEDFIGLPLFQRAARGVILSEYGRHFLPRATAIWNQRLRAIDEMAAYKALRSGKLKIGIHSVFAYQTAPEALKRFAADHPDVDVTVIAGADPELSDRLGSAELDFAFTLFVPGARDPRLVYEDLFELRSDTYARTGHPLADRSGVELEELATYGWALAGAEAFRRTFGVYFLEEGLPVPTRIIQCSSIALVIEIVTSGDFLTVLPNQVARAQSLAGRLVRINGVAPAGTPRGGLVYRPDRLETPATQRLEAIFRQIAAAMPRF